jgi:putative ABC transport system substrate-binding protein
MRKAAQALGLTLVPAEARGLDALEQAFATMARERAQVLVVLSEGVLFNYRGPIGAMAVRDRLPVISAVREYAEAGLLLSYGPDLPDLFRRSAVFVDKIFKGAKLCGPARGAEGCRMREDLQRKGIREIHQWPARVRPADEVADTG